MRGCERLQLSKLLRAVWHVLYARLDRDVVRSFLTPVMVSDDCAPRAESTANSVRVQERCGVVAAALLTSPCSGLPPYELSMAACPASSSKPSRMTCRRSGEAGQHDMRAVAIKYRHMRLRAQHSRQCGRSVRRRRVDIYDSEFPKSSTVADSDASIGIAGSISTVLAPLRSGQLRSTSTDVRDICHIGPPVSCNIVASIGHVYSRSYKLYDATCPVCLLGHH